MNRRAAAGWIAATVAAASGLPLQVEGRDTAPAAGAALPPVTPVQLSPRAWFVQGVQALGSPANQNFISNAGFVVTDESVVVVDALGSPALAARLLDAIARITGKRVSHVIVTHYHADHIYGLQTFKEAGATVIAHRRALDYLHSDLAQQRLASSRRDIAPWIDERTRLVHADRWLDARTRLDVGGVAFDILPAGPAHTPDDLVVHVPVEGVVYTGDLVFRGRIPFVGQADSRRWIESLDRVLALDARVLVPGHGPHSTDPRADVLLTRDYLAHLRQAMGEAARNLEPFDEAYGRADWSRYETLPLFDAANRANAYNTYLLMEHERD